MLSSEPKDNTPVEQSNGEHEEKQISEQADEDSIAEAPESNLEEQRTMEIVPQDPENKEPKEKGNKRDYVRMAWVFILVIASFKLWDLS